MNLISIQKIMLMEAQLGMIMILYCYNEFELSDEKDDCYDNDVVKEDEQGELINQTMRSSIFKFKDASGSTYMISFD